MSDKLKIYVAGPVSGTTDHSERFQRGALEVATLGHTPVLPIEENPGFDDDDPAQRMMALKADIRTLLQCDGIYLLDNWWDSKGARLEKLIADGLGLLILYQGPNSTVTLNTKEK